MSALENQHGRLIRSIRGRVVEFLHDEIGMETGDERVKLHDVKRLMLRHLTSIISVEGDIRMLVAFSFERSLIEQIFAVYADGIEVADDEYEILVESAAAEVINIIVGNAMADVQTKGSVINISPPVVLGDAKNITRHDGAKFYTVEVDTAHGTMSIHFIAPREWFDQLLNYKKEA